MLTSTHHSQFLKKVINGHLRTIDALQAELQRSTHLRTRGDRSHQAASSQIQGGRTALLELARAIHERGTVPSVSIPRSNSEYEESSNETNESQMESESSSSIVVPEPQLPNLSITPRHSTKKLDLRIDYRHEAISGYISSASDVRQSAVAFIARYLPGNIISINKARALDLTIQPLDEEGGATLIFRDGNSELSIGRVRFQWNWGIDHSVRRPPVTVDCEVSERCSLGLIFGRPFLDLISE